MSVWKLFSFKLPVAIVTDSQSFPQCGCLKLPWRPMALGVLDQVCCHAFLQKQNRRVKDWKRKKEGMAVQPGMVVVCL